MLNRCQKFCVISILNNNIALKLSDLRRETVFLDALPSITLRATTLRARIMSDPAVITENIMDLDRIN